MKFANLFVLPFFCLFVSGVSAGEPVIADPAPIINLWDPHRPDSHAPIGVMNDHTHEAGEFMADYRWMYMKMRGHRDGTDQLSNQDVFDRGYTVAATEMDMNMHMVMAMYGVTDRLTLMAMLNYVQKSMSMFGMHQEEHGHDEHAAAGHGGHQHEGPHSHSTEGMGDVTVGGMLKIYDANRQRVHLNLGLVLPTAEVDKKQDGIYQPYEMQLGSGTWDLQPGLTYLGQADWFSWGAQVLGTIHLEEENQSGFSYGDSLNSTIWAAVPLQDWVSFSTRINHFYQYDIYGHYDGPHDHSAPNHFQANYGGHVVELGLGLNFYLSQGILKGSRFGIEGIIPVYQDLNGVGMNRDYSLVLGLQKSW